MAEKKNVVNALELVAATLVSIPTAVLGDHPANRLLHYTANEKVPNKIPDENTLSFGFFAGRISGNDFFNSMAKLGYDKGASKLIYDSYKPKLPPEIILRLKWRGYIQGEPSDLSSELGKLLFEHAIPPQYFDYYEKASKYYPSPSDLIRFSVRDVYTPETIKKYGMDKEFPEAFVEDAKKIGIDEEIAKKYWIAHWELPSISAVFSMLHRLHKDYPDSWFKKFEELGLKKENLVTDVDTVKDLIRRQDIEPYWRDRLVALSFNPITRIDVRRMYRMGLINEEEVYYRYRDLGYAPEDAKKLAEFVKHEKIQMEKDLTVADIRKALEIGLISDEQAIQFLKELKYSDAEANLKLQIIKFDIQLKELKEKIDYLKELFLNAEITREELLNELGKMGLPAQMIEKTMFDIERAKLRQMKLPNKKDLQTWLSQGLISEDFAKSMLIVQGYNPVFAELYIQSWKMQMQPAG